MKSVYLILVFITLICLSPRHTAAVESYSTGFMGYGIPGTTGVDEIRKKLQQAAAVRETDIRQAIESAEIALDDAIGLDSVRLIGECYLSIGISFDYLGARREAIEHFDNALSCFNSSGDYKMSGRTMKLIGDVYYFSNEFHTALDWYVRVYNLGKEIKDSSLLISGGIGRGSVYGNIQKMDSAMFFFRESFSLAKAFRDPATEVQSLFYMGDVLLFSGKPAEAIKVFREVQEKYDLSVINPRLQASLYNSMTRAAILTGSFEIASQYNKLTLGVLNENSRLQHREEYFFNRYRLDSVKGDYKSALVNYRMFKLYFDSSNNSRFRRDLANLRVLEEIRLKETEIERLKNESLLKDLKVKQKRIINIGSFILLAMLSVFIFQSWRTYRKLQAKNRRLEEQQEELESAISNLKETQKQLIQAEKMASLGILASGVAHEINNPLNFIRGGFLGIKNHLENNEVLNDPDMKFYLEAIDGGVKRAVEIITALNRFSRNENSAIEDIDLHKVLDTCLLMVQHLVTARIEVIKSYSPDLCKMRGNEGKLHQAFHNIILNAVQSIEKNGKISVSTTCDGETVKVVIEDTGCGISESDINHILEPFFTTRAPGKGTGLGLSITYSILKEHNGRIDFRSVPGKGTAVTVILPA